MGQYVSVALPAMTQADIDNATTGRKSITGALLADNAGGGAAADELTQAQVEDETSTDFGLVSGERLSQAVAEFESAGGGGRFPRPYCPCRCRGSFQHCWPA